MTRVALITTTINNPINLLEWAKTMNPDEDIIVVAGDKKSPHENIISTCELIEESIGVQATYFHPDSFMTWETDETIGYNCIQRRNVALLEALIAQPEIIVTVDDDNYPTHPMQVDQYYEALNEPISQEIITTSVNGWYDVGLTYEPRVVHRGFPFEHIHDKPSNVSTNVRESIKLGVMSSFWRGDPDISALERIYTNRTVHAHEVRDDFITLDIGTWCPFNSQATAFRAELSPLMMMWPGVGRFDDIWASYAMRAIMDFIGLHVSYGEPHVRQDRNEHNLIRDLKNEMLGYEHTLALTKLMRDIDFKNTSSTHFNIIALAEQLYAHIVMNFDPLLPKTRNAFRAWTEDMRTLASDFGVNFMIKKDNNE